MAVFSDQIKDIQTRIQESRKILHLDEMPAKIKAREELTATPDFWSDQSKARIVSQELADMKSELELWDNLEQDVADAESMMDLAKREMNTEIIRDVEMQVEGIEKRLRTLELSTLFFGEHDTGNAIVSIHAGAGGTDAMDWAGMLMRMFARFVEKKGWKLEIIDESPGEEAGYKSVTFSVTGRRAYGHLKSEAGVHRLVRISPFDAEKMRHTSFVLVEVLPELDDVLQSKIDIDPKDLRVDTFMSSGKGGQSVNTTYSAVRITHIPTNIVVTCQNERSQMQNKDTAMNVLKSRLFSRMREERAEKLEELKGGHKSPEWGNQIRSYVLHPYKMVKDHRTNEETQDIEAVLGGELDAFIEAYLRQAVEQKNVIEHNS